MIHQTVKTPHTATAPAAMASADFTVRFTSQEQDVNDTHSLEELLL